MWLACVSRAFVLDPRDEWAEVSEQDLDKLTKYDPYRGDSTINEWNALQSQKECEELCPSPCRVSDGQLLPGAKKVESYKTIVGASASRAEQCRDSCKGDDVYASEVLDE